MENTAVVVTAESLVAACVVAAAARIEAEGRKGAALTAAHALLDQGNQYTALHTAAAAARETAGGKAAPKHVQAGYKLAKRFATVAEFLEKQGLSFKAIGETIGEKRSFSINLAESAMRTDSDNPAVKAYAVAFQGSKGKALAERCAMAEQAAEEASKAEQAASLTAAREAMRAQIMAELAAEQAAAQVKPARKAKEKAAA